MNGADALGTGADQGAAAVECGIAQGVDGRQLRADLFDNAR
jgi:hypothetical protein